MPESNPIHAADPANNAIVKASAGVGKTYLLVTRLIRLLMQDVRPDSILAITFTRKAAAEMQSRLFDRLYSFAIGSDADISDALKSIGINPTQHDLHKAQGLYENLLRSEYQVKISTFHAFCQEILRKFPLEANVPPGFELLDSEAIVRLSAWEALYDHATKSPEAETSVALEQLYDLTGSLHSTHQALDNFLSQRSDWWAYTKNQHEPILFATEQLRLQLNIEEEQNPYSIFFNLQCEAELAKFSQLLAIHDTKTNLKLADTLAAVLSTRVFSENSNQKNLIEQSITVLKKLFYDSKGNIKQQKENKTRLKKLGDEGEQKLLFLFSSLSKQFVAFTEMLAKLHSFALSSAWYIAGDALIETYQNLKLEQRLLDFTDLEWKTYELLNHNENSLWVQYKLDQRIDHFLIDEFQDTNPTQWRLIYPLLQEFIQPSDRQRSVFIVGDEKQSIYSFRRADPKLLTTASNWLEDNLGAKIYPMDKSRRSSPPIMDIVNAFFLHTKKLPSFHEHSTFLDAIPGKVELLPFIEKDRSSNEPIYFRNPLTQPVLSADNPFSREGELIAKTIKNILAHDVVHEAGEVRRAKFSDVMILVRSRKHVNDYESALRAADIPYLSTSKGTLFDCQEIQDLVALLDLLYTPYNNLALATVLRSPIFQCTNDDLILLSRETSGNNWYEKLEHISQQTHSSNSLKIAADKLSNWRCSIGILPMHDLLNKIFHEGNIIEQYLANVPQHLQARVKANLQHFISLALDMDSGRYPSLGRFIAKLHYLMQNDESPDEAPNPNTQGAVRILTIHASKGLEAPIVFLADSADKKSNRNSYSALIQWPEDEERPTDFLLCPKKENQCDYINDILAIDAEKAAIEDANLLYVALTRARQMLYISGSTNNIEGDNGWYELLKKYWPEIQCSNSFDSSNSQLSDEHKTDEIKTEIVEAPLFESEELLTDETDIEDIDAQQRGVIIHRALELFSQHAEKVDLVIAQLSSEFKLSIDNLDLAEFVAEASNVIHCSDFAKYFDAKNYLSAYNEIRFQTHVGDSIRQGIIDRLVVNDEEITVIDYKTYHQLGEAELTSVAVNYKMQMKRYRKAASELWPGHKIKTVVLFTHYLKEFKV